MLSVQAQFCTAYQPCLLFSMPMRIATTTSNLSGCVPPFIDPSTLLVYSTWQVSRSRSAVGVRSRRPLSHQPASHQKLGRLAAHTM